MPVALATVLGAAIGSFLNVVAYRLPRRESLIHPPSPCGFSMNPRTCWPSISRAPKRPGGWTAVTVALSLGEVTAPFVAGLARLAVATLGGWCAVAVLGWGLAGVFTARHVPGAWWGLLSALLGIVIGIYLIWRPLSGVVTLTLAVAIYFGAQGICQLNAAIAQRSVLRSWGWVVFGGLVNILLSVLIISDLPGTAEWTLGLLFGINLLMWGFSLVMTSLACRAA